MPFRYGNPILESTSDSVIRDMNDTVDAAYAQIEDAVKDLYSLGVAESAILLSVQIFYSEMREEKETEP